MRYALSFGIRNGDEAEEVTNCMLGFVKSLF